MQPTCEKGRTIVRMRCMELVAVLSAVILPAATRAQDSIPPSSGTATISISNLAAYNSAFIGISGTTTTAVGACPSGKMIVGVTGQKLKFVQKITPLCAALRKDGSFADVTALDPAAAMTAPFRLQCTPGHVVTGIRVAYHSNIAVYPFLGGVEIDCTSWILSQWSGASQAYAIVGFEGWPLKAAVACNNQWQPVRALRVRSSTAVKQLGITCDEL